MILIKISLQKNKKIKSFCSLVQKLDLLLTNDYILMIIKNVVAQVVESFKTNIPIYFFLFIIQNKY